MIIVLAMSGGKTYGLAYWMQTEPKFGPDSKQALKWKPGPERNVKPVLIGSFRQSSAPGQKPNAPQPACLTTSLLLSASV